ncbi:hypothetical protein MKW94_012167 [Papaver nudicaule]|uniref:RING-type domain-containing protein n=1 Tax=Papaver nudicaule TaxID=74823 RepID=A0AA41VAU7_PAPNU|nr:hypothetical protein [Papaver nudicaule]
MSDLTSILMEWCAEDNEISSAMERLTRNRSWAEEVLGLSDFDPSEAVEQENTVEDECFEREDIESCMKKIVVLDDSEVCSVCLQDMNGGGGGGGDAVVLKCWHTFHEKCMLEWFRRKPTCPLCRHDVRKDCQQNLKRKRLSHDNEELDRRNKH